MKAIKFITYATMLAMLGGMTVQAQDDAYMTPSKAREWRQKKQARLEKERKERAERQLQWEEENKKYEQERKEAIDWYNRRDMKVTIEDMENNLDEIEGEGTPRGGKYSQRLKRFGSNSNSNVLVLENVKRVYVMDDMDYDPWTGSYYGRDWNSGVNITINTYPYYGSYYNRWYDGYWGFGYPYYRYPYYHYGYYGYRGYWDYDPWFRGGFYGGYYGYHRPWSYGYYGAGYYDGYYDGLYSSRYYSRRSYNAYGRSSGAYYDRTSRSAQYGRALGQNSAYSRSNNGYYNRNTNSRSIGNRDYNRSRSYDRSSTTRRSNVDSGWTNRNRSYTPTRSNTQNSGGSYSSPTRSTNNGGNTGTSRVRR